MEQELISLVGRYIEDHPDELSCNYKTQLLNTIAVFRKFLGSAPNVAHLKTDLVNAWLAWLNDTGRSQATRKTRRSAIMALWRFAYEERLTDELPRAKRIRLKAQIPTAWSAKEIVAILRHCETLKGRLGNGLPKSLFLQSLFMALYSTGLRIGDLLMLRWDDIHGDGSIEVAQAKTGRVVIRYLSPSTIRILESSGAKNRDLIWPMWGTELTKRKNLFRAIRIAIESSPLPETRKGTSKWIRRAGATEMARRGGETDAQAFLDHTSIQTTRTHYIDARQTTRGIRGPDFAGYLEGTATLPHARQSNTG